MNTKQLQYFVTVAKYLNFSEAAKQLFVSQSAISHQIKELELQLGFSLFIRNKRSVTLTAGGKKFLESATEILNDFEFAVKTAKNAEDGIYGDITIGFLSHSMDYHLPPTIQRFKKKYKDVNINIKHLTVRETQEQLRNHEIDIAITTSFALESIPNVQSQVISSTYYKLAVPISHPYANEKEIKLNQLQDPSFITISANNSLETYNRAIKICSQAGYFPKNIIEEQDFDTIMLLIACEIGVGLLPHTLEYKLNAFQGLLKLLTIKDLNPPFHLVAAHLKSNINPIIPNFIEELLATERTINTLF